MIPPLLSVRTCETTEAAVGRLVGGWNFQQIGSSLGATTFESFEPNQGMHVNRAVKFKGRVYVYQKNKVYRFNPDTSAWDVAYTITDAWSASDYYRHSGLYVINISGVDYMMGIYSTGGSSSKYVRSSDGQSWTTGSIPTAATGSAAFDCLVYRDVFFWYSADSKIFAFDPAVPSTLQISTPTTTSALRALHLFNGELFLLNYLSNSNTLADNMQLFRYTGGGVFSLVGSASLLSSIVGYFSTNFVFNSRPCCLFSVGPVLYAILCGSTTSGTATGKFWCLRLAPNGASFDVTDISTIVLPVALLSAQPGGSHAWYAVHDNDSESGSVVVYLYYRRIGVDWTVYRWDGDDRQMTQLGVVDGGYSIPSTCCGDGERVWSSKTLGVTVAGRASETGGLGYTFVAHGDPTVLYHDTLTSGSFSVGEVVTGSVSGATATILRVNSTAKTLEVGGVSSTPFVALDDLSTTGGSAPNIATAPTGGGADYTVKLFHSVLEETPTTQSTLRGAVTGGTATRSANSVVGVVADSMTQYTCIWDFYADGLLSSERFTDALRIETTV